LAVKNLAVIKIIENLFDNLKIGKCLVISNYYWILFVFIDKFFSKAQMLRFVSNNRVTFKSNISTIN